MKRVLLSVVLFLLLPPAALGMSGLPVNTTTATVFIANYTEDGNFAGWGSGFFVDEGIVVTNKHVIDNGDWYRVYATTDGKVNMECFKKITRSDVKINLEDDVAYMRAYLGCEHGIMNFAEDPLFGDPISVLGYPYKGSIATSTGLTVTTGTVKGETDDGWLLTDAAMDVGNSGGPVVNGTDVVGVTVAKGVDAEGRYVTGYFIPSSVILKGLLYANDPRFGYTARSLASTSRSSSSRSSSSSSSSVSSRRNASSARSSVSSARSSRRSSARPVFPDVPTSLDGYGAITSLFKRGVIGGYPDGTFRPEEGINRAEFIKILVTGFRRDELRGETGCFSDVGDEWFASSVCAARRLGWIEGYGDGTFGPERPVNRAEAMKIVIAAFGEHAGRRPDMPSDVRSAAWYYPYVAAGVRIGIVDPDRLFHAAQDLTRADAAVWIDGATR